MGFSIRVLSVKVTNYYDLNLLFVLWSLISLETIKIRRLKSERTRCVSFSLSDERCEPRCDKESFW